jgi:hypothetical protein
MKSTLIPTMPNHTGNPHRLLRLALTVAVVLALVLALAACGHNSY